MAALLDVDRDQPLAGRFESELGGAARGEHDGARARLAPARDAIGERGQHRQAQRRVVGAAVPSREPPPIELPAHAVDLLGRAAIQLQPSQHVGTEARLRRLLEEIDEIEDVRAAIEAAPAGAAAERRARALPDVALGDQRSGQARRRADAAALSLDHQPREARMNREARHAAPDVGQAPVTVDRAQPGEQLARGAPGGGRRRVQPGERVRVADAQRREHQRQLGEIGAGDLGLVVARALLEVVARVQAQRASGAGAAGAARALGRRAWLIFAIASVGSPVQGECAAIARQARVDHRRRRRRSSPTTRRRSSTG